MNAARRTGSELWLKGLCLAASLGLHAGLGAIGWPAPGTALPDSVPIMVTLAESPSGEMPPGRHAVPPKGALPREIRSPGSARRQQAPSPVERPENSEQPVLTGEAGEQCAVAETAVIETTTSMPSLGGALTESQGSGGALPSSGASLAGDLAGATGAESGPAGAEGGQLVLARPRYATNPKPEYPRLARLNRWEGVVRLKATISSSGEVETVVVEDSSGYQLLDHSAINGVRDWRFVPARRGDVRVPCEVRIPVAFRLER